MLSHIKCPAAGHCGKYGIKPRHLSSHAPDGSAGSWTLQVLRSPAKGFRSRARSTPGLPAGYARFQVIFGRAKQWKRKQQKRQRQQQQQRNTHLLITVYLSDESAKDKERIRRKIDEFASKVGFEIVTCSLEEALSLFGEILLRSRRLIDPGRLARLLLRIAEAFREGTPGEIVGPISDILREHESVVIQIATVLIIKTTNDRGQSDLAVLQLSKEQIEYLRDNRGFLTEPSEIKDRLRRSFKTDNTAIQADRASRGG